MDRHLAHPKDWIWDHMGEAKRKRALVEGALCICGRGVPAADCCFARGHWHKPPAQIGLSIPKTGVALDACYMAELVACDGPISGEHLISESVMRLLASDGQFIVGGTPWLAPGEFKTVGFKSLTAKCLCTRHNSALHRLDDAALSFFQSLRSAFEGDDGPSQAIISGHDLERWLLKTLKVMAVSRNLGRGNDALDGHFSTDIDVLGLLEDVTSWPPSAGLYCVMAPGETTQNHNRFQLAPITTPDDAICGLWANILGISFVLILGSFDLTRSPHLPSAVHRPGAIDIEFTNRKNRIWITWDDARKHRDVLSLKFLSKVF